MGACTQGPVPTLRLDARVASLVLLLVHLLPPGQGTHAAQERYPRFHILSLLLGAGPRSGRRQRLSEHTRAPGYLLARGKEGWALTRLLAPLGPVIAVSSHQHSGLQERGQRDQLVSRTATSRPSCAGSSPGCFVGWLYRQL